MTGKKNVHEQTTNIKQNRRGSRIEELKDATVKPVFSHSAASSISAQSVDSEPDSVKVSEMIDTANGGLASKWRHPNRDQQAGLRQNHSLESNDNRPLTKGQKKRLKLRAAKEAKGVMSVAVPLEDAKSSLPVVSKAVQDIVVPETTLNLTTEQLKNPAPQFATSPVRQTQNFAAKPGSKTKDAAPAAQRVMKKTKPVDQANGETGSPRPPQAHARAKSFDVRVKLNGSDFKSVTVDSPSVSPGLYSDDLPRASLMVKLPGQDGRIVSNHSRSTTEVADQHLENRLQNMILSHQPEVRLHSTPAILKRPKDDRHGAVVDKKALKVSQSAPPTSLPHSKAKKSSYVQAQDSNGSSAMIQPRNLYPHIQGPPSLPPPQAQNIPAQMPEFNDSQNYQPQPNYAHYPSNGYYPSPQAYYPPPQAYYNYPPGPVYPQNQPYDQDFSGMVYYGTDGQVVPAPYYPPTGPSQYYESPVPYSHAPQNSQPYQQNQHYDYYSQHRPQHHSSSGPHY